MSREDWLIKKDSCAFTGHRPGQFSFGYDEEANACQNLRCLIDCEVANYIHAGVTTFYTGMALGVDQWAALSVIKWKDAYPRIKLVAVRPCETQADRWTPEQQARYYDVILPNADETVLISYRYTPQCMMQRNRYMVEHSDCLLAVYDGSRRGGTAYTVRYAAELMRPITVILPDTLQIKPPSEFPALARRWQLQVAPQKIR